jgi:hypothetical protein
LRRKNNKTSIELKPNKTEILSGRQKYRSGDETLLRIKTAQGGPKTTLMQPAIVFAFLTLFCST